MRKNITHTASLYVIAAPSGGGKTSLVNALIAANKNICVSVSHTTRPMRPGEQQNVDYHFVDENTFQKLSAERIFLEQATVHGYHYGTSRAWVLEQLQQGNDVILEIDWQGALQIRQQFPHCVSIFIMPPSRAELEKRLQGRGQDSQTVIAKRLAAASGEIAHVKEFDYLIVNAIFADTLAELQAIFTAQRLRTDKQLLKQAKLLAEWQENG
jgi:guanylate kinase